MKAPILFQEWTWIVITVWEFSSLCRLFIVILFSPWQRRSQNRQRGFRPEEFSEQREGPNAELLLLRHCVSRWRGSLVRQVQRTSDLPRRRRLQRSKRRTLSWIRRKRKSQDLVVEQRRACGCIIKSFYLEWLVHHFIILFREIYFYLFSLYLLYIFCVTHLFPSLNFQPPEFSIFIGMTRIILVRTFFSQIFDTTKLHACC